jgi:hypothetical protein
VEESGTVGSPGEVVKIRQSACSRAASLEGRPTGQPSVDTPLVVVGGEAIQLSMEVEAVPEEGLIEILTPKSSDKALDERVRARYEGDRLEFLDIENAQVRPPAMKPEQRVMIGTEAPGKLLAAAGLVEHAAGGDPVDVGRFDTESDDPTRKNIHDDHHPEALQNDGFASEQVDAPNTVLGFSDNRQPRWTVPSELRMVVLRQNPPHHVFVDLQSECVRNLLGDARAAEAGIESLDFEDCGNQFL